MNKYNIDFFYMHLFTMWSQCVFKSVIQSGRSLVLSKIQNTWLKLPVGVSPFQLVYLHRNRRYFVIKLHTWFCLSYFLKTNITFYCIYQYYMSINSFFNTVPVSVSRYSRPITNETSHVTTHATHSDPWPTLARSTRFFFIMLFNKIWKIDRENLWQKIVLSRNFS
jgi:hypothetical protein